MDQSNPYGSQQQSSSGSFLSAPSYNNTDRISPVPAVARDASFVNNSPGSLLNEHDYAVQQAKAAYARQQQWKQQQQQQQQQLQMQQQQANLDSSPTASHLSQKHYQHFDDPVASNKRARTDSSIMPSFRTGLRLIFNSATTS